MLIVMIFIKTIIYLFNINKIHNNIMLPMKHNNSSRYIIRIIEKFKINSR